MKTQFTESINLRRRMRGNTTQMRLQITMISASNKLFHISYVAASLSGIIHSMEIQPKHLNLGKVALTLDSWISLFCFFAISYFGLLKLLHDEGRIGLTVLSSVPAPNNGSREVAACKARESPTRRDCERLERLRVVLVVLVLLCCIFHIKQYEHYEHYDKIFQ